MYLKNRLLIIMTLVSVLNILILRDVEAKYVYTNIDNVFSIQTADNLAPEINGRNYNVQNESFNTDVQVFFSDKLGVKFARYYFKAQDNIFSESDIGIDFESGFIFENSGFYKIEVSDLYNNKTQYTFLIDKEVNKSEISIVSENDTQVNVNINLVDIISGIQKAELYVDNELYKSYNISSDLKKFSEEVVFLRTDINFYEEIYVVGYDCLGNSKKSESIILNEDKIYDLEDLYRFNSIVNNKICDFYGKSVYLMNNIIMEEEWNPIWYFNGEFDGKNHTISGFYMDTDDEKSGFFAENYGVIRNFTIIGEIKTNSNISSGLCGENFGKIINCRSRVKITSYGDYVDGHI